MKNTKPLILFTVVAVFLALAGLGCSKKDTSGGIFKSSDKAEQWQQKVFVRQDSKNTITIAEFNVNKIIQDNLNLDSFLIATASDGIYRTQDGGESWAKIGLSGNVTDISLDPSNSTVIIAAKDNVIYKSQENFQSMVDIYISPDKSTIVSVIIDPFLSNRYFGCTKSGQLVISQDGGVTWSTLYQFGEEVKMLYQAKSDTRVLYAVTVKGLYRSNDAGQNWQNLTDSLKSYNNGKKINSLFIDPTNYSHLYLATDYGLLSSSDAGQVFQPIKTLVPYGKIPIKVFSLNPNNLSEIYFGVGQIIHKSTDGGNTWKTINSLVTRRNISYLIVDRNNENNLYLGVKSTK